MTNFNCVPSIKYQKNRYSKLLNGNRFNMSKKKRKIIKYGT